MYRKIIKAIGVGRIKKAYSLKNCTRLRTTELLALCIVFNCAPIFVEGEWKHIDFPSHCDYVGWLPVGANVVDVHRTKKKIPTRDTPTIKSVPTYLPLSQEYHFLDTHAVIWPKTETNVLS